MQKEAIFHQPYGSFAFTIDENTLRVRIRVKKNQFRTITALLGDRYQSIELDKAVLMTRIATDDLYEYFQCDLYSETRRLRYTFYLEGIEDYLWYGDKGISKERNLAGDFQFPYINEKDLFHVPEWAKEGIIYQIFPERFANGNTKNDPENVEPWSEKPKPFNFFGGDLDGIIDKLSYLEELGINVIYLTPIFESPSNHKYDTTDYYKIDPHFGDLKTVKKLVKESHRRGIKIIFDAVFNHSGYNFLAFQDVIKNGMNSKYKDWFYIHSYPIVTKPHLNYETFANDVWNMPKLRTSHPEVREYLLDVAHYWIKEVGIDGWRLDVANEIDHDFWREFRKVVKRASPDALIVGEIWHDSSPWLEGDQFDSVMNYLFKDTLYDFFAKRSIGVHSFNARLTRARMKYKDQANYAMFNLLDSHDTERFLNSAEFNEKRLRLAALFQMTYIGMPMIYYGTEIGMTGFNDPDCRKPMEWNRTEENKDLLDYYKKLIAIRKATSALTKGSFHHFMIDEIRQLYGFTRIYKDEKVLVMINPQQVEQDMEITLPFKAKKIKELISNKHYLVKDGKIKLAMAKEQGMILKVLTEN